ncbi:MAG: 50S ribosomal protein L13 [Nanoarchaeota archaeon]
MKEINVDATNAIVGRLGTYVAKQALLGRKVNVFNSEKALMSGNPKNNVEVYRYLTQEINTGRTAKGPFICRYPDRLLKRFFRSMLPWAKPRGRESYKRIMCYISVPQEFKDKKLEKVSVADGNKLNTKHITVGDLSRRIGGHFNA